MSFISVEFLVFFVAVVSAYFMVPHRWRWVLLLVASYFFYAYWNVNYIVLIVFSTLVDYVVARQLAVTDIENIRRRKFLLSLSIGVNLGVLFLFKYFNFFNESLANLLTQVGVPYDMATLNVLLPVGISFYTFQSMAYTIDVYRGQIEAETHFGRFATYIAFFPQLVAGPIERAGNMLPQFRQRFRFDEARVVSGFQQMLWGFFKKMVVADRLAIYVNEVYNNVPSYSAPTYLVATVFFAFQIYCDFSGYSDIAIGVARVMGFELMENFRQPYLSRSIGEFWGRWHISLSTWFRDYLYIPLGGNRVPFGRELVNLMVVFVVSGLWHGANWTFVIWGALHGAYLVIERLLRRIIGHKKGIPLGGIALTFALTCFAWIFFRANSVDDAFYIVGHMTDFSQGFQSLTTPFQEAIFQPRVEFVLAWVLIGVVVLTDWLDDRHGLYAVLNHRTGVVRWMAYYGTAGMIALSLFYASTGQAFVYFQF